MASGPPAVLCVVCEAVAPARAEKCPRCGEVLRLHNDYRLDGLLGSGGQSRVYAAHDKAGHPVAIKVLALNRAREWKNIYDLVFFNLAAHDVPYSHTSRGTCCS